MSGLELNKIAGAVLLAGLIAMVTGTVADKLYHPEVAKKRGFQVAVEEEGAKEAAAPKEEEKIDVAALLAAANPENGKAISKKCETCHSFEKGGPNKVGPDLWSVVGRARASHEGYSYSDAMKKKGGQWTYEELFAFVNNPKAFVPGTKMAFAGIKKPKEIADLLAYIRTQSDSPVPLPAATVKKEAPEDAPKDAPKAEEKKEEKPAKK